MAKVTLLSPTFAELDRLMYVVQKSWELAKTTKSMDAIEHSLDGYDVEGSFIAIMQQYLPLGQYLNFIWSIEDVPRAFMDQLDRHHSGHYWEQSFRVLPLHDFAERDNGYYVPQYIRGKEELPLYEKVEISNNMMVLDHQLSIQNAQPDSYDASDLYHSFMGIAQKVYNQLIKLGMPSEQARGVIPLHVNTRTTFVMPWYFGLREVLSKRSCFISQGEYWFPVITGMISELRRIKFPEELIAQLTTPPCRKAGKCTVEKNMLERLGDDPNDLCPLFIDQYNSTGKMSVELVKIALEKNKEYVGVALDYGSQINDDKLYNSIKSLAEYASNYVRKGNDVEQPSAKG